LLLEEGPEHYQIWKHLSRMIMDGKQNAFSQNMGIIFLNMRAKIQNILKSSMMQ